MSETTVAPGAREGQPAGRRNPASIPKQQCEYIRGGSTSSACIVDPCYPSRPRLPPWATGTFASRAGLLFSAGIG